MWNKEPTAIINGLSGLLTQIVPLLVILGVVTLTPEKMAALISIIGLVLTFVSTTLLRSLVTPTTTANTQIQKGIESPKNTKVSDVIEAVKKDEQNANQNTTE